MGENGYLLRRVYKNAKNKFIFIYLVQDEEVALAVEGRRIVEKGKRTDEEMKYITDFVEKSFFT